MRQDTLLLLSSGGLASPPFSPLPFTSSPGARPIISGVQKTLCGFLTWRVPTNGWHRSPTLTAADGGSMPGPAKHPSLRHPTKNSCVGFARDAHLSEGSAVH
eukprot:scaffold8069_cov126-Isochrysis_galbana.AAC.1